MKCQMGHAYAGKGVWYDNVDIFSKRRKSSIKIDSFKSEDQKKSKNEKDKIRKIRQMVDFDENSLALSTHQKNINGIIE